jgi:tetratricopeptide (TPR) repeat protein
LAAEIADNPDEFAREIASELAEHTFQAETRRAIAKPAPHSAWEHVVRAMAFSFGRTADGPRSIADARAAVAAAPDYGLAHAALAGAVNAVTSFVGKRLDAALKRELHEHAARALQLDGDNPAVLLRVWQAHISLGDGETMLRLARRLVELRPHSPLSHRTLGASYFTLGRTVDAIAANADSLRCRGDDPDRIGAYWSMGWCHLLEGQPLEAEVALDQALALVPNHAKALQFKAIAEALLGKEKAAFASIRRLRDVAPDVPIEQHISFMTQNPRLARRSDEHIAILRRLWDATEGSA